MDNIVSNIGLSFTENNYFINIFFPNKMVLSSIEIAYIGSIFHFVAFLVYVLSSPRTVDISLTRSDYVMRSAGNIHTRNVSHWTNEINRQVDENEITLTPEVERILNRYKEHVTATLASGEEVKFDNEFDTAIISILQCRYESENNSKLRRRAVITCFMLVSFGLGGLSTIGTIIENLIIIL